MKILVTGGSGFMGTDLVSDLIAQGHTVVIYDKQRSEKYPDLCIVADIRDKRQLVNSMQGVDAVYHLAAEHRDDVRPVSLYYDINVGGAENIVYGMEKNDIGQLIFSSTVAVYGLRHEECNETSLIEPFNDYGWSKYKSEVVFNKWVNDDDKKCLVIVRPAVVFGEGNRGNFFNLLRQIASGRFIMVGNGKNKKSMAYVRNISQFLTMLLNNTPGPGRHVYNYADKPDIDMENLVKICFMALGQNRKAIFRMPYSMGLLGGYAFDFLVMITGKSFPISSIRIKKFCANTIVHAEKLKEIGFSAPYSLTDGIYKTILFEFSKDRR
jgi:nucleoside-diphosphate-sugar epimerase